MSDEIVFYTNPQSRGRVVRWMLEEVGQPYRTEVLAYGATGPGGMKSPAYLAVNPMGKVPALKHRGQVITEGAAICAYLADAFPESGLAPPPGDALRGAYFRWLFFCAGPLEAAASNRAMGWEPTAERERMMGYGSYAQTLDALEAALDGRDYLAGPSFTAADLYVGAHLSFGMMFGTIEKRPAFEAYVARVTQRPASIRAREIDDALTQPAPG
jgi:glutathione S-transferase